MNQADDGCFICGSNFMQKSTPDYIRCTVCGHEILARTNEQGFILNDHLSETAVKQITGLDKFKSKTLELFDQNKNRDLLLDIGSASGKFLLLNKNRYFRAIGIEITPEAVKFSKEILKLNVVGTIEEVDPNIDTATAWHTLEHIPSEDLVHLLKELSRRLSPDGRIVVSVPNAASRQYLWFGKHWAYYDVPNHLHQFTPKSLQILMGKFGFKLIKNIPSWPYNTFGFIQALLNVTTGTHNYLYYRLKRRSIQPSFSMDVANMLLLIAWIPVGWFFSLTDMIDKNRQGVITACFEKNSF